MLYDFLIIISTSNYRRWYRPTLDPACRTAANSLGTSTLEQRFLLANSIAKGAILLGDERCCGDLVPIITKSLSYKDEFSFAYTTVSSIWKMEVVVPLHNWFIFGHNQITAVHYIYKKSRKGAHRRSNAAPSF